MGESLQDYFWEPSGSVVECLTRDRGAVGSSLTGFTALWSLSKTHLSELSTGLTQEDPSLFNWKIVDVKNQIKQDYFWVQDFEADFPVMLN